jgi:alkylated DNA repair dioxygenase AlkB
LGCDWSDLPLSQAWCRLSIVEPATTHINPEASIERIALDATSWVDVSRGWLTGAETVYSCLLDTVSWRTNQLFRYERQVEEKRLGASWQRGRPLPHPALGDATRWLQRRYKVEFPGFSMIQYRDGSDGQGFHRDTDMRWLDDTIIAILTLGATRPWLLRPRANRYVDADFSGTATLGATHDLQPADGDLIVLGGRCQADWEHSVPYLKGQRVTPRISMQWRFARKTGEPFMGPSFRSDVRYGHGKVATQ